MTDEQRKYLSFNGRILEISIEDNHKLQIKVSSLDLNARKWKETAAFSWTISKVKVELLSVAEILEESTCRRIPVALVALNHSRSSTSKIVTCYIVYIDIERVKCVALRKFSVDPKLLSRDSVQNIVHILDDPEVLFLKRSKLIYYQGNDGVTLKQQYFPLLTQCKTCKSSFEKLKFYCWKSLFRTKIFFMEISFLRPCPTCHRNFNQDFIVLMFRNDDFTKLDPNLFVPNEFHDQLSAVKVHTLKHESHAQTSSELYACTKNGFVLSLKNGLLIKCVTMNDNLATQILQPVEDKTMLHLVKTEDRCNILVVKEKVCIMLDQTLKTHRQYKNIQHVFYGDFSCNGTVQCLFLKSHEITESEWILDDCNQLCINSEEQGNMMVLINQKQILFNDEASLKKHLKNHYKKMYLKHKAAVQLLKPYSPDFRSSAYFKVKCKSHLSLKWFVFAVVFSSPEHEVLEQEQLTLQERKQNLCKKKEFTTEVVDSQFSAAAGLGSNHPKADLVTLVGTEADGHCTRDISHRTHGCVLIHNTWQRTYNGRWCVGVEFQWRAEKDGEVWLNIVPNKDTKTQLSVKSKPILCQSDRQGIQSRQKRKKIDKRSSNVLNESKTIDSRLETQLHNVICVTDIPKCSKKSLVVSLHIKWRFLVLDESTGNVESDNQAANFENCDNSLKLTMTCTERTIYTQHCGNITLDSQDVIHNKHEINLTDCSTQDVFVDSFMEDFHELQRTKLAWKTLQTCTDLTVKSSTGNLAQLDKMLVDRCSFTHNNPLQCYVTHITTLCKVQIELPPFSDDASRHLRIYTSSDKDILLLLHHLYNCLPDNIVIHPDNNNRQHLQEVLTTMHQETSFLSHGVNKLLDDHDSKMSAASELNEQNNDKVEDVRKVSERFKRKREEMLEKQNNLVEISDMEDFLTKLTLVQKQTDTCLAMANSTHS